MLPLPRSPWQITGNHWITVPCISPADASIHCISALHSGLRGSIEFAGDSRFIDGDAPAMFKLIVERDGKARPLGEEGIAWERESGWLPSFSCKLDDLAIRGVICAPHGRSSDISGLVYEAAIENRGAVEARIDVRATGSSGMRFLRIRTSRQLGEACAAVVADGAITMCGMDAETPGALAAAGSSDALISANGQMWEIVEPVVIPPGEIRTVSFFIAAARAETARSLQASPSKTR